MIIEISCTQLTDAITCLSLNIPGVMVEAVEWNCHDGVSYSKLDVKGLHSSSEEFILNNLDKVEVWNSSMTDFEIARMSIEGYDLTKEDLDKVTKLTKPKRTSFKDYSTKTKEMFIDEDCNQR